MWIDPAHFGFEHAPVLEAHFNTFRFLHHVPVLVHLDRVDAAVGALVVVLRDRLLERAAELLDAAAEDVGEADQEGEVEAPVAEVVHQVLEVDLRGAGSRRRHLDVAGLVDGEEVTSPAVDVVKLDGILDRPGPKLGLQLALPPPRAIARAFSVAAAREM